MSIYVEPSTTFEATAQFDTGLTGTIGVRITDNAGNTTTPRTTTGIAEYPAGSGIYEVTLTSPGTAGQYSLVWDDGTDYAADELVVTTATVLSTVGSGNLYYTSDDLKAVADVDGDYADTAIDIAVAAASRAIDGYMGTRFYPTTETRYYTPDNSLHKTLAIADCVSITSLTVDTDNDGTYDQTWVENTDFFLDPPNAALEGKPGRWINLIGRAGRAFPTSERSVKIVGSFGWATAPAQVQQAAGLLAHRLFKRLKNAPFAIQVATAGDAVAMANVGRIDPDVAWLLEQVDARRTPLRSLQLS